MSIENIQNNIFIGTDFLESKLIEICQNSPVAIIADTAVLERAKRFSSFANIYELPSGEENKTRNMKEKLEDCFIHDGLGRDVIVVAMGGGVTTDLVGFLASTYLRGVRLILVPTTLLAMVDAAIGGKTGVNTELGKNLIGTFYLPESILIDQSFLSTLPEIEMQNGLFEILKMGFIFDSSILEEKSIEEKIKKAILAKLQIVALDPFEKGIRRILNFGHTIGHAIEMATYFQVPHGLAVGMGCLLESFLSYQFGYLSKSDFAIIQQLLNNCVLPKLDEKRFYSALSTDKKRNGKQVRTVLMDRIGHAIEFEGQYCREISVEKIQMAMELFQNV